MLDSDAKTRREQMLHAPFKAKIFKKIYHQNYLLKVITINQYKYQSYQENRFYVLIIKKCYIQMFLIITINQMLIF